MVDVLAWPPGQRWVSIGAWDREDVMEVSCFIVAMVMMLVGGLLGFMGRRLSESKIGRDGRER